MTEVGLFLCGSNPNHPVRISPVTLVLAVPDQPATPSPPPQQIKARQMPSLPLPGVWPPGLWKSWLERNLSGRRWVGEGSPMSRLGWWAWPFWGHNLPRPSGYQLRPEKELPQLELTQLVTEPIVKQEVWVGNNQEPSLAFQERFFFFFSDLLIHLFIYLANRFLKLIN